MRKDSEERKYYCSMPRKLFVKQPYTLTNARYKWTPLMCNIVGVILYHASHLKDQNKLGFFGECSRDQYNHYIIEVPYSTLHGSIDGIGKRSRNYKSIEKAVRGLWQNPIEIHYASGTKEIRQIIVGYEENVKAGKVILEVDAKSWDYLQRFRRYTEFDILKWLALDTYYSKRIALLAIGWVKPIRYKVETLIEMFCLPESYPARHIISKVFIPAKKALDDKGEVSFGFMPLLEPQPKNGRPKILGFQVWREDVGKEGNWCFDEPKMIRKMNKDGLKSILDEDDITALISHGFKKKEIMANIYCLFHFALRFNLNTELDRLHKEINDLENSKNSTINNPKGYYITKIKELLKQ